MQDLEREADVTLQDALDIINRDTATLQDNFVRRIDDVQTNSNMFNRNLTTVLEQHSAELDLKNTMAANLNHYLDGQQTLISQLEESVRNMAHQAGDM